MPPVDVNAELKRRDLLSALVDWVLVDDAANTDTGISDPVIDYGARDLLTQLLGETQGQDNRVVTATQVPTLPFAAGAEFTGSDWIEVARAGSYIYLLAGINDFATVELEWSDDGVTPNGTATAITNNPTAAGPLTYNVYLTISNTVTSGTYFRAHVINGPVDQDATMIGIATVGKFPYQPLIGIESNISLILSAILTRSILAGKTRDDTFNNVGIERTGNDQFALLTRDVGLDNNRTVFGSLNTETPISDIRVDFSRGVLNLIETDTANGGGASQSDAMSILSTGVNPAGNAQRRTRIPVRYQPGSELRFDFTAVFTAGVADSQQHIGALSHDDMDGIYIGFDDDMFMVTIRRDGINTTVPQSSWNGDALDGSVTSNFTRDGEPESWDPTFGNIYRIRLGWLGFSVIFFEVQSPDGAYVTMHTVRYPNQNMVPSIYQTSLDMWAHVANTGNTTDLTLSSGSWRGGTLGAPRPQSRMLFQKTDEEDGTLPTGGAVIIHPVFNSEANVFDSGWIPTFDYPGGNFLNLVGDTALDVYLLNASDETGSNIVGAGAPTIQAPAFIPSTFQSPYFDDFYRIVVVNSSGAGLTDYTIHNRGHESAQQGLILGLEQTMLSFFTAALVRSQLVARTDAGNYTNIRQSDDGGLRTSVVEHETDTPLRPLIGWSTNGVASLGTTPVQIVTDLLANRVTVSIKANPGNTKTIYVGSSPSVGVVSGYPLAAGDSIEIDLDDTVSIYARSETGNQTVHWAQGAQTL